MECRWSPISTIFKTITIISLLCSLVGALSQEEKESLLKAHNDARRSVVPTASDMLEMEWSHSIAAFAQEYAERCVFDHSSNSERVSASGSSYGWIGENLYLNSSNNIDASMAVTSWDGEKTDYRYSDKSCSAVCGHYTQVIKHFS